MTLAAPTAPGIIADYWSAQLFPDQVVSFAQFTTKRFTYAVTDDSEFEVANFYQDNAINFFEIYGDLVVKRLMSEAEEYTYTMTVNYYRTKQENTDGVSWQSVRTFLDFAFYVVRTRLGESWGGYVDYWRPQEEPTEILEVDLAGEKVWKGIIKFIGIKTA